MVHDMWIFPALHCVTLYFNYGRYLPGDEAQEGEGVSCSWNSNAEFCQTQYTDDVSNLQSRCIMGIWAVRKINGGE